MICRRCGAELPDNAIRCNMCGIKVNMLCPECKVLNPFGNKLCNNCGFELLKTCPACGSLNTYSSQNCRKCNSKLEETIIEEISDNNKTADIEIVGSFSSQNTTYYSQEKTLISDINKTNNSDKTEEEEGIPLYQDEKEKKVFVVDEILQNKETEEQTKEVQVEESENDSLLEIFDDAVQAEEEFLSDSLGEYFEQEENIIQEEKQNEILIEDNEEEDNILVLENDKEETDYSFEVQPDFVNKVINLTKNSLIKNIIAINGEEGSGKSAVLSQANEYLVQKGGYISLYGSCTPLIQITSFGFFQDAFLRLMGFPPYIRSVESFVHDFQKSGFAKAFNFLDNEELSLFLNIFYPNKKDNFEYILENKKAMFSILEKVIKSFLLNNNLIILIDNFELLDGASYDFIVHLLKNNFFNNRLKLIVAYHENKSIQSYFDAVNCDDNIFETIVLKKLSREEIINAVNKSLCVNIQEILPPHYLNLLLEKANGNAIRLEQEIALLFDSGYFSIQDGNISIIQQNKPEIEPASFEELLKLRLNYLTPLARNILFVAAIMGYRFATNILCHAVSMPIEKAEETLNYLIDEMFIQKVDNYTCEFRSLTLWKLIYQEAKDDLLYKENSQRLYASLKPLILSSNLQKLISCTEALSKNEAFLIWQNTANLTAKLGDTNLYIIAQKQCLKLLEEQEFQDSEEIKSQIYEEIGKLLYEKSPSEALTYLAYVLDSEIKESNLPKIIDISGYLVKSCYLACNYFGANESVDAIINSLTAADTNISELEMALLKTRKLKALLHIGNCEQVINLVNDEIIPELDKTLQSKQIDSQYKTLIIDSWLLSKIALAKAYTFQGSIQTSEVILQVREFIEKYNYNSEYYNIQIDLVEALYNTLIGNINTSTEILNKISIENSNKDVEPKVNAEWNLISILNRIISGQKLDLKVDLFELAAYTNNINEHFIKNIIKLLLGYIIQEEGNNVKALEIYNEEITYFAKEKVAIGALLSWALIVRMSLLLGDDDKALSTATKSLEIAQSPKINNYYFIICFQKYLAEIYLKRGDYTAAKMYLEQSIIIAKQNEMKYQQIELCLAYARYIEQLMEAKRVYSAENVNIAAEMYNKAVLIAKELRLNNVLEIANRARVEFKTFCQLNSINI